MWSDMASCIKEIGQKILGVCRGEGPRYKESLW